MLGTRITNLDILVVQTIHYQVKYVDRYSHVRFSQEAGITLPTCENKEVEKAVSKQPTRYNRSIFSITVRLDTTHICIRDENLKAISMSSSPRRMANKYLQAPENPLTK